MSDFRNGRDLTRSPKLQSVHLERSAVVYVRQSTPQQVQEHQESTARQYALADRAAAFGWSRESVVVIDDDLGKSGQSIEGRPGFQRLLAEVALDRVGLILGLEMSRLARSCRDWHQLLELCARFRVLLGDADGLYDPTEYSDRLLLGLHGMMNEAELHVIKQRMHQGKLNKARRGELFSNPPIGYIRAQNGAAGVNGEWVLDPDEQVQAVVRMIFDQFDREATLHGLLRYLVHHGVRIPVRNVGGDEKGRLEWRRPNRATLQNLLRHPTYAGAYRFGHRALDPRKKQPGKRSSGRQVNRPEDCLVLIHDRLPAYITWERFEANQNRLTANRNLPTTPGAPRSGSAILAGLMRCGRCGRKMTVRYSETKGGPTYACTRAASTYGESLCQSLSHGAALETWVAEQLLAAVAPAALEASLAAVVNVEQERASLARQWQLKRERAAFEVDRAARQFHACEPENRLVARSLERAWEEALQRQQRLDDEFDRWRRAAPAKLSDDAAETIRGLAADLPRVWSAASTTSVDRRRIARFLLEQVIVVVDKSSERVDVALHWVGGSVQRRTIARPTARYSMQAQYPRLIERLRELCLERRTSNEIADLLNAEGFRPPKRTPQFTGSMIARLTAHLGLARRQRHGSQTDLEANEYRPMSLARRLGLSRDTVRRWLRAGWLNVRRDADGHHVIWADAGELARLRELHALPRDWANRARLEQLKTPGMRPAR
jgi:DNA invertase Pin-like site-specific DNA recombinase